MNNYMATFTYEDKTCHSVNYATERAALAMIELILNKREIPREGVKKIEYVDLYNKDKLVRNIKAW